VTCDEARIRRVLDRAGLLLEHDARWPSVSSLVAGDPVRGSWWGHSAGGRIFAALTAVEDDVAFVKLLAGKVTLVHRRLWPAVVAVGRARDPWQIGKLRADAADVLELVDSEGTIATTEIELAEDCRKLSTVVTDLERRMLLVATQEHTPSGKHIRVLHSWTGGARACPRSVGTAAVPSSRPRPPSSPDRTPSICCPGKSVSPAHGEAAASSVSTFAGGVESREVGGREHMPARDTLIGTAPR
jgi:hypothetical protein